MSEQPEGSTLAIMTYYLRQLENITSTTEKKDMLLRAGHGLPEFKEMLVYALDPYKKYYLKQLPSSPAFALSATWETVKAFLDKASTGNLRGSDLIMQYNEVAARMRFDDRMTFTRVVLKDLRCGVGATLVNQVFPGLIPEFGVMLAQPLLEKHIPKLQQSSQLGPISVQPKENGDRVVVLCPQDGPTEVLSRTGITLHNYNNIGTALKFIQASSKYGGLAFDGEVIAGDFFKTRSVKRNKGNEAADAKFHMFEAIHLDQWSAQETENFSARLKLANELTRLSGWRLSPNLVQVKTWKLRPEQITWEFLIKMRDWLIRKHGKEGLIVRPDVPYNFKTRSSLFKLKDMDTMDCTIEEILLGDEGHKHAHHAGRVLVRLDDNETLCKAGLKMTEEQRDEMWSDRAQLVGRTCEVAYQELTRNKDGVPKLQFPVFLRMRDDK